ncbi:MAG: matrixin family metalloprotease [Deltaproteobacteria bacterium]|nr:matrixin family metalloprotease [Deltaproteobacteria bacterium]
MTRAGARALLAATAGLTQVGWSAYLTDDKVPIRWYSEDIPVVLDARGTPDVEGDAEFAAIRLSMQAWNRVARCAHPSFTDAGTASGLKPGAPDKGGTSRNLVVFEDEAEWERNGHGGETRVIALTTLFYAPSSGVASKFDMELADFAFDFGVDGTGTDIRNTVTHELGHALGLDHSALPAATMFASAPEGDLTKRTLADDDTAGLCAIYADWIPGSQAGGSGSGCAAWAGGGAPIAAVIVLALAWMGWRARARAGSGSGTGGEEG